MPNPPETLPAMLVNVPFPDKFQVGGNMGVNWKKFRRVWDNYEIASRLKYQSKEERTAHFITSLSAEAQEIYDGLQFDNPNESKDIDVVLQKFEAFCIGETNEIYERYVFNKRDQEQNENIDTYVTVLRRLAKSCNYGGLEDALIRDRIVVGLQDNHTRKRLLQEPKLTLKSCLDICRASESTSAQAKAMDRSDSKDVHYASSAAGGSLKFNSCKFCGNKHKRSKESCPAWGQVCKICKQRNHFAVKCPNRSKSTKFRGQKFSRGRGRGQGKVRDTHMVDQEDSEESMFTIQANKEEVNTLESKIYAKLVINKKTVCCQVDCGSTVNVLPLEDYKQLFPNQKLEKSRVTLNMYNKVKVVTVGQKSEVIVTNPKNNKSYSLDFQIVERGSGPILGSVMAQEMGFIKVNYENIMNIESHTALDMKFMLENFPNVFRGEGLLEGDLHLEVDSTVPPVKLPPRKPPITLREKYKAELKRLEDLSIITKVNEPSDWISSVVVVTKPNGKIRLCIDPKPLNKALKRNNYPLGTIDDVLPELSKARIFSVADVKNGFWHVRLDAESSKLTTFATPWGRFRWKRMPFGISPAPEEFARRLQEALEGLPGVRATADDILIWGVGEDDAEAIKDHDRNLLGLLRRCESKGVILNKAKFKLKLKEVAYIGHLITSEGLKVDPKKVDAIVNLPRPTDRSGVLRLMGMLNYLQKFAPNLSKINAPLRELLKQDVPFYWDDSYHGECLKKIKRMLCETPVLRYFDPKEPEVTLQCDASQSGLGACLMQAGQPVSYAARALTTVEERYAQIEKELLAILFAVEKYDTYLVGMKVKIETDHKPLETIFRKSLVSAPKRLQSMLLKLQKFDLDVVYKKGSQMYLADTLSRAYPPHKPKSEGEDLTVHKIERSTYQADLESINMASHVPVKDTTLEILKQAAKNDPEYNSLISVIQSGWPDEKTSLPEEVKDYFNFRDELAVQNGLIYKSYRVVVPESARKTLLNLIHSTGHQGIQSSVRRAREAVFWPRMNCDIQEFVSKCKVCCELQSAQTKQPMISHEIPDRPWEKVGCDLFEMKGKHYLITVDYYSDFYEIDRLSVNMSGSEVIPKLKAHFARYGLPSVVVSDNGPPFNSQQFADFSKVYDFDHVTSSPAYPQSNGKAENAVKQAKMLMLKASEDNTDPYLGLLAVRNTPGEIIGLSPAQRMFNRRARTNLPIVSNLLKPEVKEAKSKLFERKAKETAYHDRNVKELAELKKGEIVRVSLKPKDKWRKAKVVEKVNIRSYKVRTEDGREYRRNRKFIRKSLDDSFVADKQTDTSTLLPRPYIPVGTSASSVSPVRDAEKPQPVRSKETDVPKAKDKAVIKETRCGREIRKPQRYR